MELYEKIKKEIIAQGRTITWISKKLGISQPTLSQRLNGHNEFKESEVVVIEKLLGVTFERNEETK